MRISYHFSSLKNFVQLQFDYNEIFEANIRDGPVIQTLISINCHFRTDSPLYKFHSKKKEDYFQQRVFSQASFSKKERSKPSFLKFQKFFFLSHLDYEESCVVSCVRRANDRPIVGNAFTGCAKKDVQSRPLTLS